MTGSALIALPSGGALHVEGNRDGPPVVFFHGVGGGAWSWEPQRAALAPDYRVYTWEARGHGAASPVADAGFADYLDDAREALAAVDGDVLPALVGHSMGGFIATILAAEPDTARALVLIDPVYNEANESHVSPPFRAPALALVAPLMRSARRNGPLARTVGRAMFNAAFTNRQAREAAWHHQVRQVPFEYPSMFVEGIAGVSRLGFRPFAEDIDVPTLLLNGRFPRLREALRRRLGDRFSDETIAGGHYLQLDRPDAVTKELRRFLSETAERDASRNAI